VADIFHNAYGTTALLYGHETCYEEQMKEHEMGGTCSTHEGEMRYVTS
jgi:hypothetical protein